MALLRQRHGCLLLLNHSSRIGFGVLHLSSPKELMQMDADEN